MKFIRVGLTVLGTGVTIAALALTSACGGGSPAAAPGTTLHYTIVAADDGQKGSDGNTHDTFAADGPTTVTAGAVVTVTVVNKDDAAHSFTLPDFGIDQQIPGKKTTTFQFTADKSGTFRWYCKIPCDGDTQGWAMNAGNAGPDQDGFMAGYITVQ